MPHAPSISASVGEAVRLAAARLSGEGADRMAVLRRVPLSPAFDRRVRAGALALALVPAAALALAWPFGIALGIAAEPWLGGELAYAHARFAGTAVEDARGRFVGVIPAALDSVGDVSAAGWPSSDHKALPVHAVPPVFAACLRHLEDRRLGSWLAPADIDPLALLRVPLEALVSGGRAVPSASTLPMQLARMMWHEAPGPAETWADRFGRKLREWVAAAVLMRRLSLAELERWLAMHVPLAVGAPGSSLGSALHGIGIAGRILFGKPPEALDPAEQALLAAAFWRPVLLAPVGDTAAEALRDVRWAALKRRAARCFTEREEVNVAVGPLEALERMAAPEPRIDPALAAVLPEEPAARFRIMANPFRRAEYLAGPDLRGDVAELREAFGPHWRDRVAAVRLTTDAAANRRFRDRVDAELARLDVRLGSRLDRSLTGGGMEGAGSGPGRDPRPSGGGAGGWCWPAGALLRHRRRSSLVGIDRPA
jgi:hypothetical protein